MDRHEAQRFLEANHRAVLATIKRNGVPQLSPVMYALMDGKIRISGTWTRAKTANLKRDPRASLCVLTDQFFPPYLVVEGHIALVEDPDGRKNARLYEAITGAPPKDMREYLDAMHREQRLIYEMDIERLYPLGK